MFRAALQRTVQALGRLFPRADAQSPRLHFVGDDPGLAWEQVHQSRQHAPAPVIVESPMNPFALLQQQMQIEKDEAAIRSYRMHQNLRTLERLEAEIGIYRAPSDRGKYQGAFVASHAHRAVSNAVMRRFYGG